MENSYFIDTQQESKILGPTDDIYIYHRLGLKF